MFVITLQGGAIQTIEFVPAIQADNATIPLSSISGITWDA